MERIEQVVNYIQHNLTSSLPLTELSDVACMSPIHFHRIFVKNTGYTPKTYVELLRIQESLEGIKKDMKVQDIAYSLGFNSYETFSRTFKKYLKLPPSDLKALFHIVENETEAHHPAAVVNSQNPVHIAKLFSEEVSKGVILKTQLPDLQVCTIQVKSSFGNSRKLSDRYSIFMDHELSQRVIEELESQSPS